jgi:hypothetical protein
LCTFRIQDVQFLSFQLPFNNFSGREARYSRVVTL